jgi:flagellar biosynthetic protein FliQ
MQAATQIQEQTLTFVPKILAILAILAILGGWMFTMLGNYTIDLFRMIPSMAG